MNLKSRHIVAAVALHLLLFGLLLGGAQCSHKTETLNVIQGTLIRADQLPQEQADPTPKPPTDISTPEPTPPPPAPKPDPAEVQREQAQEQEQQKQKDAADAKVKAEQLKQETEVKVAAQKAADLKKLTDAEEKKKAEDEAKKKADATEKKRVEDLQTAAAAEDKKRIEDDKKKKAKLDADAKRAREAELAEALGAETEQRKGEEASIWGTQLVAALERVWRRPPGQDQKLSCKIRMQLSATGEVLAGSVSIVTPSGNTLFDQSVVRAAYNASPLPLPRDPTAFQSGINITFSPRQ